MIRHGIGQRICLAFILLSWVLGCSEEERAAQETCEVCDPGTISCVGEYVVTCSEDGTSSSSIFCGEGKVCDASSGTCTSSQCPAKGFRGCTDDVTRSVCVDGQLEQSACETGEVCMAGTCVSELLEGTVCGYLAIIVGTGSDLAVTECGPGEACVLEEGDATCTSQVCEAGTRTCQTRNVSGIEQSVAQVCNGDGTGADSAKEVNCTELGGACVAGFCVCGGAPEELDAVEPEVEEDTFSGEISITFDDVAVEYDAPEIQVPDKAEAYVAGEKIKFQSTASVDLVEQESKLVISFASGQKRIEISISQANETWSGTATHETFAFLGYNDGTGTAQLQDFKWGAGVSGLGTDYGGSVTIVIEQNGGPGTRVVGTFEAELTLAASEDGGPVSITDGEFDILYPEDGPAE